MKKASLKSNLDPEIFSLLIEFTDRNFQKRERHAAINWDLVLQAVQEHRITGLAYDTLNKQEDPEYPSPAFYQAVRRLHHLNLGKMAKIYRHFEELSDQLNQDKVDFLVLKGPAVAYQAWPDPAMRYFGDLDLMVREEDWPAVSASLDKAGYAVHSTYAMPRPKLIAQDVPLHETRFYHRQTGFVAELHYEDLFLDGLAARDIQAYWQRAAEMIINGVTVKTLSLQDHFLHLCSHAHQHGYRRMFWFSDLLFILRNHQGELNWDQIIQSVRLEELQVPVYYTLNLAGRLFDFKLPPEVIRDIRPDGFRRWWHERCMSGEWLGSKKITRVTTFPFNKSIFYGKRPLNLLVMGRRSEKLCYYLRRLFPPSHWMREAYHVPDSRILAPYYLTRPAKILLSSMRGVFNRIKSRLFWVK